MILVEFLMSDFPFEKGDVVELPEAEAFDKRADGVVAFVELPEAVSESEGFGDVVEVSEPEE
jgi:hypothetical protein